MKEGKGFLGSQYIWNDGDYRKYFAIRGNKVELWVFEYDKKSKRYLPYGPGQKILTLDNFKQLLKKRPIKRIK